MPKFSLPPNVNMFRSRHGSEFCYHQRNRGTKHAGSRTRISGLPFNPDGAPNEDWWRTYRALEGLQEQLPNRPQAGTFASLIAAREVSGEWAELAETTRSDWTRYHKIIKETWADRLVTLLEPKHVMKLRDWYADIPPADPEKRKKPLAEYKNRPAAANHLVGALSATIAWGIPHGWRSDNPCDHVPRFKGGEGYLPWPMKAIAFYRKHGKQRLWWVAATALYTGQRMGDVLGIQRAHVKDGEISVTQDKTDKRLWIPMHRDLKLVLADMAEHRRSQKTTRLDPHLLTNSFREAWTTDGFKSSWATEMDRREFRPFRKHRLVFHGLRKSAVVMLLEASCTTAQVASITGQSYEMVEHYAKEVNQRKLARAGMTKWESSSDGHT